MALFVVKHQHEAERCPAKDPFHGASLLNHLSRPNVRRHGVTVQGEAIVQGEHTLYLIVEADHEASIREFMAPFSMAGSLDVYPASTCARVVAGGGCGSAVPATGPIPAVDPEEACQHAIDAGLVVHRAHPLNCETSIPALIGGTVMPNARFYIRNHFQIPTFDAPAFRLSVAGLVDRTLMLSLRDLMNMPSRTLAVTLECAGNGRKFLNPPIDGEQWNLGAASTAEWTGVPLNELLNRAGIRSDGREVLFRGADCGTVDDCAETIRFERSLPIDTAREGDVLLAYAMNGEPLPVHHGYPLRLIVPGWYAVASVKWLTDIEVIDRPFEGHYQRHKYWFHTVRDGQTMSEPVTLQRVRSLVTEPAPDQHLPAGEVTIRGVAWSGAAPIARVDVSIDGRTWHEARLVGDRKRYSWQWWELPWRLDSTGEMTIRSRATDLAGRTQPEHAEWNRQGYGNNAIQQVTVTVG
jgi:DMSO/TMAO reductase YedYZ molybdopterin-dependent catalytic subunit